MARSSQAIPPHHSAFLCSVSSPWADEVAGNSSSPAPAALARVMLVAYFGHEIAPSSQGRGLIGCQEDCKGGFQRENTSGHGIRVPGCEGVTMTVVLPQKVGKMFWAGKARSRDRDSLRNPSFAVPALLKSPSSFLTIGLRICKHHFQEIQAALEPSTSILAALRKAQPEPYDCTGATNTSLLFQ